MSTPTSMAENLPRPMPEFTVREMRCECGATFASEGYPSPLGGWFGAKVCPACVAIQPADPEAKSTALDRRVQELACPPRYVEARIRNHRYYGSAAHQAKQRAMRAEVESYCRRWPVVDREQLVLVFQGGPGTGKNHLAWAIAHHVVKTDTVRFVKLPDMIRDLRATWGSGKSDESDARRLNRYRQPRLLIVDEISQHAFYGQPHQHLYDVVDHRCDHFLPTILITNECDDAVLREVLGPAVMSRARYGAVLEFGTEDYREWMQLHPEPTPPQGTS